MVALTKKELLHQSLYFGKRSNKGSNRKRVVVQGLGIAPYGEGITLGAGLGYGMNFMSGGSLLSKLKSVATPLLKKGAKTLVDTAKAKVATQIGKIQNPELKKLAEAGLKTGTELVDQALSGNKDLSKYQDILKSNLNDNKDLVKDVALSQGTKLASNLVKKKGGRAMNDTVGAVTDRKLKPSTVNGTTDNRQLTLLKDIIRSKPLNRKVNRGSGLSYF